MPCVYSNFNGECTLWNKEEHKGVTCQNSEYGFDKDGYCIVEEDPTPSDNCSNFESSE